MKSPRRTLRTQSTKYSSLQGAAKARCPLKRTRSKHESMATIKLVNLITKRDSVFMASSSGLGPHQTSFWREDAVIAHPFWLRLCRIGVFSGGEFLSTRLRVVHGEEAPSGGADDEPST